MEPGKEERKERAKGRGRLSSLDKVPEAGQEAIREAYAALNKREKTQAEILDDLNGKLVDLGLADYLISKSAFGRRSVAIARAGERIKTSRAVFAGIADHLTPENIDQGNVALGEFIKALIAEIVSEADGAIDTKGVMELASAFRAVVGAQAQSHKRKTAAEKDMAAKVDEAAKEAGRIARKAGLSADTVDQLKAQILGIRKEG